MNLHPGSCVSTPITRADRIASTMLSDIYALLFGLDAIPEPTYSAPVLLGIEHDSCPINSPPSCSIPGAADSCCYEATNGLFLQTQFWDYAPATGGNETWTIHGLWSDKCLGGFNQFCNKAWEIDSAAKILEDAGEIELLGKLKEYWRNLNGDDASLWLHEFNKHGTCMSTVNPDCYGKGAPKHQYVVDFYKAVVALWETLPSFEFLTQAGIYPDETTTHTLSEWNQVLGSHVNGKHVYLGCDHSNSITEIWYFFTLQGALSNGEFTPTDSISTSTCRDGFKWRPKREGRSPPGHGNQPRPGSKYIMIDGQDGCLISDGSWYKSGQCASYRITDTIGGVQLRSSRGPCGIVQNHLVCGKNVEPSDFTTSGDYLLYGGSETWSASRAPTKWGRVSVSPGGGELQFKLRIK